MYCYIVQAVIDGDFSLCLEPYREVSRNKYVKAYRLVAKRFTDESLSLDEEKFLKNVFPEQPELLWLSVVLIIAEARVTYTRTPLKSTFEDFRTASVRLWELLATDRRKKGSVAWKDGHIGTTQRGGAYDFS